MKFFSELKSITAYLKPYRIELLFAIIALLLSSSAILLLSQNLRGIVDDGLAKGDSSLLNKAILQTVGVVLILGISTACRFFFITRIGEKILADLRRKIHNKILDMSPSFFETNKTGELLSQLSGDTTLIYNLISSSLSIMMRNIVMLIGGITLLLLTNLRLTVIIFAAIPIIVIPMVILGRNTRKLAKNSQEKIGELTSLSEEVINNIKTIQAYSQENTEKKRFDEKLEETIKTGLDRITARSILTFFIIAGIFSTIAFVLSVGSRDVISGAITAGQLSSFIFLTILCAASMGALSETINNMNKASGVSERITSFLNTVPEIVNCENPIKSSENTTEKAIIFQNITFHYPSKPEIAALKNFSATFLPGKTTALVGESGAGKSTIFQLLLRFYNIGEGVIKYGDTNINEFDLQNYRSEFAYVSQDHSIFSATIFENILYSNPRASADDVYEAAKMASASDFIKQLPKGFNTFVGEKGVRLSGGQKQRIAIARAILKRPKILLLDEATSALDVHNEKAVQQGINTLIKDRTCIIIAHRLSTIENAHNIIVMKNGEICEQGNHDELIKQNGYYTSLYTKSSDGKIV